MDENSQGPVQPLESGVTGRGVLDSLLGKSDASASNGTPSYTDPIVPEAVANSTQCPNCFNGQGKKVELKDGVCSVCEYDKKNRVL